MNVEDPRYIVVENGIIRQLQVTNVSAADEGIYSCRVQSKQSDAKLLVARTYNALHILSVLCKFVNDLKLYATTHRRFLGRSEVSRSRKNVLYNYAHL